MAPAGHGTGRAWSRVARGGPAPAAKQVPLTVPSSCLFLTRAVPTVAWPAGCTGPSCVPGRHLALRPSNLGWVWGAQAEPRLSPAASGEASALCPRMGLACSCAAPAPSGGLFLAEGPHPALTPWCVGLVHGLGACCMCTGPLLEPQPPLPAPLILPPRRPLFGACCMHSSPVSQGATAPSALCPRRPGREEVWASPPFTCWPAGRSLAGRPLASGPLFVHP